MPSPQSSDVGQIFLGVGGETFENGGAVGAMNELNRAIEVFDQSGATFHPIAAVEIVDAIDVTDLGAMDMTTNQAINAVVVGDFDHGLFKIRNVFHGVFHALF